MQKTERNTGYHYLFPGLVILTLGLFLNPLTSHATGKGGDAMSLTIHSSAFQHNASIPKKYTCEGDDISPPLQWSGLPAGTKSLVLIVDDPDAPDPKAPRMTWVHWVLYNIPPYSNGLQELLCFNC